MDCEMKTKVIELRRENPCYTLEKIGNICGISKTRVRQILLKENLPTRNSKYTHKRYINCLNCGRETPNRKYCSADCRMLHNRIMIVCDRCGKEFYRSEGVLMLYIRKAIAKGYPGVNRMYCSYSCFNEYRKYGSISQSDSVIEE